MSHTLCVCVRSGISKSLNLINVILHRCSPKACLLGDSGPVKLTVNTSIQSVCVCVCSKVWVYVHMCRLEVDTACSPLLFSRLAIQAWGLSVEEHRELLYWSSQASQLARDTLLLPSLTSVFQALGLETGCYAHQICEY